jgi:glycosyltransferase involved in cell wall biosynthesis
MKILIIFTSSYPIGAVSTHRTHNLAKGLKQAGADVTVLITHPTENKARVLNDKWKGNFEGVNYKNISRNNVRKNNIFLRKATDYFCHLKLILYVLFNRFKSDAMIVIGPSIDFRILLPIASKIAGQKSFIEINEYPFVGKESAKLTKLKRWFFLHFIIPLYDGHIVISENLKELISKFKSEKSRIIRIPVITNNVVDFNENLLSPFNEPYIFHAGSLIENKDGILGIIEAFGIALKKIDLPIKYVFTGRVENSPNYIEIIELIKKYNLQEHIVFTGYIPDNEIPGYFMNASLSIINKYDTLQNRYCFATKLTEYIKYRVPVITTNVGESNNFLIDGINAFICEEGDVKLLSDKIIFAISNPEKSRAIANNAKNLLDKDFNAAYQGQQLKKFIEF